MSFMSLLKRRRTLLESRTLTQKFKPGSRKLIKTAEGKFKFLGDSLPFPKLLPMAEVPAGGYPESHDFNVQFTTMLNQLQAAWQDGNPDELENAIDYDDRLGRRCSSAHGNAFAFR
jgi:hypothetical protein